MTKQQLEAVLSKEAGKPVVLTEEQFQKVALARGERPEASAAASAPETEAQHYAKMSAASYGKTPEQTAPLDWALRDAGVQAFTPPAPAYDTNQTTWDGDHAYRFKQAPSTPVYERGPTEPAALDWTPAAKPKREYPLSPMVAPPEPAGGVHPTQPEIWDKALDERRWGGDAYGAKNPETVSFPTAVVAKKKKSKT